MAISELPSTEQQAAADLPAPRNGAETLILALAREGVEYIFLNPGTDTAPIQEALVALRGAGHRVPEIVPCLYENVALAGAMGYWDVTRRPQLVIVHVDVGTQNLGGNLHDAQRGQAGVVILAGRAPYTVDGTVPGGRDRPIQWQQDQLDQIGIVRNYVKWAHELGRVDTLELLIPRAFQVAASEPSGPVYMTMAREVMMEPARPGTLSQPARAPVPATPEADPTGIETLAAWLVEAEAPLAIAGTVGRHPEAVSELVALAELLGLPVASGGGPVNMPWSHPLMLGGEMGPALRSADCVLLLDVDVPWVPKVVQPPSGAKIAQIDIDPVRASFPLWGFPVDLALQADTAKALPQLRAAVERRASAADRERWAARRERVAAEREARDRQFAAAAQQLAERSPIEPEWLSAVLAEVVPDEALVMEEVTTNSGILRRYLRRDAPGSLLTPGGPGLGWVLGAAVGAKLAAPERDVVAICGDGSFVFASPIAALWAAQQARAPFLTVIFNNGGYQASKNPVVSLFPDGASVQADAYPGVRFPTPPDYAMLARSCHAHGERVTDPREVRPALERALAAVRGGTAAVVDVVLKPI